MERNPEGGNEGSQAGRVDRFSRVITDEDRRFKNKNYLGIEEEKGDGKFAVNICISGEGEEKRKRSEENDDGFEQVKYLDEYDVAPLEKPVITFSHVSSVAENEIINFDSIRRSHSRSESPLLEVPNLKIKQNEPLRPPL